MNLTISKSGKLRKIYSDGIKVGQVKSVPATKNTVFQWVGQVTTPEGIWAISEDDMVGVELRIQECFKHKANACFK